MRCLSFLAFTPLILTTLSRLDFRVLICCSSLVCSARGVGPYLVFERRAPHVLHCKTQNHTSAMFHLLNMPFGDEFVKFLIRKFSELFKEAGTGLSLVLRCSVPVKTNTSRQCSHKNVYLSSLSRLRD